MTNEYYFPMTSHNKLNLFEHLHYLLKHVSIYTLRDLVTTYVVYYIMTSWQTHLSILNTYI